MGEALLAVFPSSGTRPDLRALQRAALRHLRHTSPGSPSFFQCTKDKQPTSLCLQIQNKPDTMSADVPHLWIHLQTILGCVGVARTHVYFTLDIYSGASQLFLPQAQPASSPAQGGQRGKQRGFGVVLVGSTACSARVPGAAGGGFPASPFRELANETLPPVQRESSQHLPLSPSSLLGTDVRLHRLAVSPPRLLKSY